MSVRFGFFYQAKNRSPKFRPSFVRSDPLLESCFHSVIIYSLLS